MHERRKYTFLGPIGCNLNLLQCSKININIIPVPLKFVSLVLHEFRRTARLSFIANLRVPNVAIWLY